MLCLYCDNMIRYPQEAQEVTSNGGIALVHNYCYDIEHSNEEE